MRKTGRPNNRKKETIRESLGILSAQTTQFFLAVYGLCIIGILPLYYKQGYASIGLDKAEFYFGAARLLGPITGLAFVCLLICKGKESSAYVRLSATDCFALLHLAGAVVSYFASSVRRQAALGAEGWYMGFATQMLMLLSYFLISRFRWSRKVLYFLIGISSFVFLVGILNCCGIYFLPQMDEPVTAFISTIGNINWYCGYQVLVGFIAICMLYKGMIKSRKGRLFCVGAALISYGSLLLQGSNSGYVALAAVVLVMLIISAADTKTFARMLTICEGMLLETVLVRCLFAEAAGRHSQGGDNVLLILSAGAWILLAVPIMAGLIGLQLLIRKERLGACAMRRIKTALIIGSIGIPVLLISGILLKTKMPETFVFLPDEMFLFRDGWGSNRGIDFMAGWQCFAAQNGFRQLFGVGPDCMHTVVYGSLPQAFVDRLHGIYGEMVLTNAHNEWLTMMVNQGIVGAVSFAGMLISAIRRYLSSNDDTTFICGICLIAYTANNMFSFQQLLSTPTMYILLGLAESCIRHKINKER